MHIIRNYLLKELAGPFLLALLVSTMIFAAGHIIQVADYIMNQGINALYVFHLFFMLVPWLLTFTIPVSMLAATLLSFGRLASDNEIIAMKASGISLYRIAAPAIIIGFIVSLFCIPLNNTILPEAGFQARKLIKEIGLTSPLALLEPGVTFKGFKDYIVLIHGKKGNTLSNIRIYQPQEDGPSRTIVAEEGEVISYPDKGVIELKLKRGSADQPLPQDKNNFYKIVFDTYHMTLDLKDSLRKHEIDKKPREMSIKELQQKIEKEKERKDSSDKERDIITCYVEMHNKVALAFSSFIFVLIGMPIAVRMHRREKSINFGLTAVLFLAYWGLMLGGVAFAIRKIVPPWAGVWMANFVLFIIGSYLFLNTAKK